MSLLMLELLRRYKGNAMRWTGRVADTSFGIFFFHQYIILILVTALHFSCGIEVGDYGVPMFLILTTVITAICYYLVLLAKRIVGSRSRMLFGS